MLKRILALALCLVMTAGVLSGCSGSDSSSSASSSDASSQTDDSVTENISVDVSLVIDGEEIDTSNLNMCTINGLEVSFDEFRYYWLYYIRKFQSLGYDVEKDAEQMLSFVKLGVMSDLTSIYGTIALAKENSLDYTVASIDLEEAYIATMSQYQSEEEYKEFLVNNGMTDSAVQSILNSYLAFDKAHSALFDNGGKFFVKNDDVLEVFKSDKMARCYQILIPYSACTELSEEDKAGWDEMSVEARYNKLQSAYEELDDEQKQEINEKSLALAQDISSKLRNGEDFVKLMEQYNYDPEMIPQEGGDYSTLTGYYFTEDYSYVKEFIDGTFAINAGEVSDVITSEEYGYHIVKRLPVDIAYVEDNIESLAEEYNLENENKILNEYYGKLDIEFSEYFEKLTLDSIS